MVREMDAAEIPDQAGRTAVVTGANSGLGLAAARALAVAGRAYCQSKLANVLFARELDRRLRAAGSTVASMAAHPGYAATNLQAAGPPAHERAIFAIANRVLAQSAEMGAPCRSSTPRPGPTSTAASSSAPTASTNSAATRRSSLRPSVARIRRRRNASGASPKR